MSESEIYELTLMLVWAEAQPASRTWKARDSKACPVTAFFNETDPLVGGVWYVFDAERSAMPDFATSLSLSEPVRHIVRQVDHIALMNHDPTITRDGLVEIIQQTQALFS
jgi:hypothetical protein